MSKFVYFALSAALLSAAAIAQNSPSSQSKPHIEQAEHHSDGEAIHPGSKLRYVVMFEGDPDLAQSQLHFRLIGQPNPDQNKLGLDFWIGDFQKVAPGKFEIRGDVPVCPTGKYQLDQLNLVVRNIGSYSYMYPVDFRESDLTIHVENATKNNVPVLKSIAPETGH